MYTGSLRYCDSPPAPVSCLILLNDLASPPAFLKGFFLGTEVSYHGNEMWCALTENVREFIANTQYMANLPAVLLKQNF